MTTRYFISPIQQKPMTTYVLTISAKFPKTHSRSGQETNFFKLIQDQIKKHTIRGNYPLWQKRFKKIEKGEACLSVRQWSGVPYQSKQIELIRLDKSHGIGIEKLEFEEMIMTTAKVMITKSKIGEHIWKPKVSDCLELAQNDGLSFPDFQEWFKKADLSKPMAIIHFSDFRYNKHN